MAKLYYGVSFPPRHIRDDFDLVCSECGATYSIDSKDEADHVRHYMNYCTNCGATFRKTKYEIKEFGHLIKNEEDNICLCSNCGIDIHNYDFDSLDEMIKNTSFCYNCGVYFKEE